MAQGSSSPPGVPRWLAGAAAVSWRVVVVIIALIALGEAFIRLDVVAVPVIVALLACTVLWPPAAWLRRHGVPSLLATWLVFFLAAGAIAGIIFGLLPGMEREFGALGKELSRGVKETEHWLVTGPLHLSRTQVDQYVNQVKNAFSANTGALIHGALSGVTLVVTVVGGLVLSLVLSFFLVKDGEVMARWAVSLAAEGKRADMTVLGRRVWRVLSGYVHGTALNGLVDAALMSAGMLALGVPFVAPIALLTFIGGFLPIVGAIVSGLLAALAALVAKGALAGGVMVGVTILVHNVEGYLVGPFVLGRAVKLHPAAILVVLGIGTILGSVIGAFLAVPIAAVCLTVIDHYRSREGGLLVAGSTGAPAALLAGNGAPEVPEGPLPRQPSS